ncbi:MAG TPA: endonuclease/exonuclease/phosphatase family protein [Terrimicrobiaceae bacterium]|nr:endonuclease/exonuclease/phosphatase family protein [Terrimicrobiaceae bacterium]
MRKAACWLLGLILCAPLQSEEICVVSYNVGNYWLASASPSSIHQPVKPEAEIAAVIKVLNRIKPDIIGLIEIGDESMLEDFHARLKAAGLEYAHREWIQGADETRHICLLSRFPIVERNSRPDVRFELDGKPVRMNRGILDVTVAINADYHLRLVGAHLKSRRDVPEYDQARMRAKEASLLRKHLEEILTASPETNLMLFGDLNDTKNEYPVRQIIGSKGTPDHMMDLWLRDSRGERWTYYWKTADEYSRIDYFLVSPGLLKEVVLEKCGIDDSPFWDEASDHRAIYAVVFAVDRT